MKKYIVARNCDFYGADTKILFDKDELNCMAAKLNTTAEKLIDEYDIEAADYIDFAENAEELGLENRPVYVARKANRYGDIYFVSFDRAEAEEKAEWFKAYLCDRERVKTTVSLEKYSVPVMEGQSARNSYDGAVMADILRDPEEYKEI